MVGIDVKLTAATTIFRICHWKSCSTSILLEQYSILFDSVVKTFGIVMFRATQTDFRDCIFWSRAENFEICTTWTRFCLSHSEHDSTWRLAVLSSWTALFLRGHAICAASGFGISDNKATWANSDQVCASEKMIYEQSSIYSTVTVSYQVWIFKQWKAKLHLWRKDEITVL